MSFSVIVFFEIILIMLFSSFNNFSALGAVCTTKPARTTVASVKFSQTVSRTRSTYMNENSVYVCLLVAPQLSALTTRGVFLWSFIRFSRPRPCDAGIVCSSFCTSMKYLFVAYPKKNAWPTAVTISALSFLGECFCGVSFNSLSFTIWSRNRLIVNLYKYWFRRHLSKILELWHSEYLEC